MTGILLLAGWETVMSQPLPPGGNNVPIDGGSSLLLVGAAAYGAYRYRKANLESKNDGEQEDE